MRCFGFALASLVAVLTAGSATGQTKKLQDEVLGRIEKTRSAGRLEEQIEIFRRLLNRGLAESSDLSAQLPENCPAMRTMNLDLGFPLQNTAVATFPFVTTPLGTTLYNQGGYPGGLNITNQPYATLGVQNPLAKYHTLASQKKLLFPLAEGVYLKGHGVVYSLTLRTPVRNPLATSEKPADKPLSAWEREQRELRGEKLETPKKSEVKPPSVSETILRLLAENGKHFTDLAPDEHVTVAIVFRPAMLASPECAKCHSTGPGPMGGIKFIDPLFNSMPTGNPGSGPSPGRPGQSFPSSGSGKAAPADPNKPDESFVAVFRNNMTLADLHVKQGKAAEAVKVYRDLIAKCAALLEATEKAPAEAAGERLYLVIVGVELHSKLAQAQIATGNNEAALKTLQDAATFSRKFEQLAKAPTPPLAAAPSLPSKLVISVPKKLLDQVGVSAEDFRKWATIEYTGAEK